MEKKRTGFSAYLPLLIVNILVFTAASLLFAVGFGDSSPVPFFAMFAFIQTSAIIAFALIRGKARSVPRHASKIVMGMTLLLLAGVMGHQNFQIEGFFYLLLAGFVGGPIVHFGMKVLGTLFTGRVWCSWGCWTAAVLDLLPYNKNTAWSAKPWKHLRYLHFALSAVVVIVTWFVLHHAMMSTNADPQLNWKESASSAYWIVAGNVLYYSAGVILALILKDNRAFCKYLCPVAVLLKGASAVSIVRVAPKSASCGGCRECEKSCPASIAVHSYVKANRRVASTECLMCLNCVAVCPEGNLRTNAGCGIAKERLTLSN